MLTAIPRAGALRGCVPSSRKQPGAYSAQVVEAQDEVDEKEANEARDDKLAPGSSGPDDHSRATPGRGGPNETVLSKTSVVGRSQGKARQAHAETSICGAGNLAIGKTTKVVNWEETEQQVMEVLHPFRVTDFCVTRERAVPSDKWCDGYRLCSNCVWNSWV